MNNLEMKSEVMRMLVNMRTSDPFYADVQSWVNRGLNDVVLMGIKGLERGIDLFPELRCSWDSELTIDGINNQAMPGDKLLITSVGTYNKQSPNHNFDRAQPMSYFRPEKFDTVAKPATRKGFPTLWTMRGHSIYYYPTPSVTPTDYRTLLLYHGIQREPSMSADDDAPVMSDLWHDTAVLLAAAIGARSKGWLDKMAAWDAEVKVKLDLSLNIGAVEDAAQSQHIDVEGLIDRVGVYGGN